MIKDMIKRIISELKSYEIVDPGDFYTEIYQDGFRRKPQVVLFGKAFTFGYRKKHYWKDIVEINSWVSDGAMASGIKLVNSAGKNIYIKDYDLNWDDFFDELPKQFKGFNMHNFKEGHRLTDGTLPCWNSKNKVDNLRIDSERRVIVWEKDGSVFDRIAD